MSEKKTKAEPTPRQREIEALRKVKRDRRSEQQSARLSALVAEEKRDRFNRLFPRRVERLKKAAESVIACANVQSYAYETAEAEGIAGLAAKIAAEIRRAYQGAPKERGLFDL